MAGNTAAQPHYVSDNAQSIEQRLDDLKLQLCNTSSNDKDGCSKRGIEEKVEGGLQHGLSAAASALQAANLNTSKEQQQPLDQQHFQQILPKLQLQLQLYAADAAAPALSFLQESEIMAAAQQGR